MIAAFGGDPPRPRAVGDGGICKALYIYLCAKECGGRVDTPDLGSGEYGFESHHSYTPLSARSTPDLRSGGRPPPPLAGRPFRPLAGGIRIRGDGGMPHGRGPWGNYN